MDIADWRQHIDEIDRKLVELLNQRADAAHHIGLLKKDRQMAVYEPERERTVVANAEANNKGPLSAGELKRIFERVMDVMRKIQVDEIAPNSISEDDRSPAEIDFSRAEGPEKDR